jgi:hypothetical protein
MDGGYAVYADGLRAPRSLTFDAPGNLSVGDDNDGLLRITPDGEKQDEADQARYADAFAPYLTGSSGQYLYHIKGREYAEYLQRAGLV